ncbi:hypothetical protein FIBSPDRAFT_1039075 [Athelia psychrophila]|uniref:L-tryptophan decarboxylase PsiD-like domain-containing protein n=1 Tax=Athelia psychrophila TaxID=1759441 RepID=A0A166S6D0_9AGAM|nr:hypothetical protein FIBSPDRAFT_1039075 [Fibularhizoctonia sp. CBS 109695]
MLSQLEKTRISGFHAGSIEIVWCLPSGDYTQHIPAVEEFKNAIEGDAATNDIFDQIFQQVPNFETLLSSLDCILPKGLSFHIDTDAEGNVVGEPIGVPIYLIFDLPFNAAAAYDLFRRPRFNAAPKNLLDTYAIPDPNADHRGFKTWNTFLTKQLKEDARPVDFCNKEFLIHGAYESAVYRVAMSMNAHHQFWLKSQKCFLQPLDYHRWHAPINSTIEKFEVIDGSYFTAMPDEGTPAYDPNLPEGSLYSAIICS